MVNDRCEIRVIHSEQIRHRYTNKRLCDIIITENGRCILIDVERDNNGRKKIYREDITDKIFEVYEKIVK